MLALVFAIDFAFLAGLMLCLLPLANVLQGCNCCHPCDIFSDDFAVDDLATNWTTSGTVAISGGVMTMTTSGAYAICNAAHPDGDSTMAVSADFKHSNSGSFCDIWVGVADSNNYFRVRFKVAGSSGSIEIAQISGGSPTILNSKSSVTMNTGTFYTALVCVSESGGINVNLNGAGELEALGLSISGTKAALGNSGSGTATFDNFAITKTTNSAHAPACTNDCAAAPSITCGGCSGSAAPEYLKVVTSGITDQDCDCSSLNGTFYVPWYENGGTWCRWRIIYGDFAPSPCGYSWDLDITYNGLGGSELIVDFNQESNPGIGIHQVRFRNDGFSSSCTGWTDESIAWGGDASTCNASSATCLVSAA